MLRTIWPALLRDRFMKLLALTIGAFAFCLAVPGLRRPEIIAISDYLVDPIIIGICLISFIHARRATQHFEERRFWDLLFIGFSIWLAIIFSKLTWSSPGHTTETYILSDTLYLAFYLTIFFAIESRPHRSNEWSRRDPTARLETFGATVFVTVLLVYAVLVPGRFLPSLHDSFVSPLAAFLSLDILILGRTLHFRATSRNPRWISLYGWFAVSIAFAAFNDLRELMAFSMGNPTPRGGWSDLLWYPPLVAYVGMARSAVLLRRSAELNADDRPTVRTSLLPQCSLAVYSFLLPILHLIWYGAGFLDASLREIRDLIVLAGLLVLASITVAQYFFLDRQNRALREQLAAAEENLHHARRMEAVGRLAGGIAHDFNNLLMIIRGYTEIAQDEARTDAARRANANILGAADRAVALTKQLLAFSRKQVIAPRALDVNAVVEMNEGFLRQLMGSHIQVHMMPAPDLWPVCADRGQIEQVLMNLAANARDAMPSGGTFVLRSRNITLDTEGAARLGLAAAGDFALLEVKDDGMGMSPDVRCRIFEPFFTTKPTGKGTGLGMATVYAIVRQCNGAIQVESCVGLGTKFSIYLPRTDQPVMPEPRATTNEAIPAPGSETILLVEDEESVRALAREFLTESGYAVLEANSPAEALHMVNHADAEIHLLLTDVIMPGMCGREVAERLTELRPEMKVLFISGHTDDAVMIHGVAANALQFLQKPFTRSVLLDRVRQVLNAN